MQSPELDIKISVVICSYNRADYIIQAIESLHQQNFPKDQFEVLVVDNNSIDNTSELVMEYKKQHHDLHLSYLTEQRQGASFARNTGAKFAKGRLLCFMDDDAVAEADYLRRIVVFFDAHPDAIG